MRNRYCSFFGPTLDELSLELDLSLEGVVCEPGLGERYAVLAVDVFALEVTEDEVLLVVLGDAGLEENAVGCLGLDLEGLDTEGVVLAEEVVGALSEVFEAGRDRAAWVGRV